MTRNKVNGDKPTRGTTTAGAAKGSTPPGGRRHFFVTGCASGIGLAMMKALASQGHNVTASDINIGPLKKAVSGFPTENLQAVKLDVRSAKEWSNAVAKAVNRFGRLDVLMNIAGYLKPGYIHETDPAEVERHFMINSMGVVYGTQAAARVMTAQGNGHIINIASLAGVAPIPGISLYSASKFAVRGFSLAAAEELEPHGVFVTVVCPDAVRTPMLDMQQAYKEAALTFSGPHPLLAEDVVRVILEHALPARPREILIPLSRGILAKIGNAFPGLARSLAATLRKKGLRQQASYQSGPG